MTLMEWRFELVNQIWNFYDEYLAHQNADPANYPYLLTGEEWDEQFHSWEQAE